MSTETRGERRAKALKHYQKWLTLPFGEKFPMTKEDFAHQYGVSVFQLQTWDKKLAQQKDISNKEVSNEDFIKELAEDWDVKDFFNIPENKIKWLKGTLESAEKGNAQSQRLIAQILDVVVEKQEVAIGLTAEELARRNIEATRTAREFREGLGAGMVELSS